MIKGNFDPSLSATEFLVETNPRQAFGSWMEKYINDDDDYRLKLVVKRGGLFGPKTLARSKKFRIFRVGPIDRVPRDQRFVLDMLQPEASVKVDADEQNYLKVTLQRNMAVRFGSRDTIHVKIVHAENAYPTRAYETVHGSNKASPSSSSSHIDLTLPIFGLQP